MRYVCVLRVRAACACYFTVLHVRVTCVYRRTYLCDLENCLLHSLILVVHVHQQLFHRVLKNRSPNVLRRCRLFTRTPRTSFLSCSRKLTEVKINMIVFRGTPTRKNSHTHTYTYCTRSCAQHEQATGRTMWARDGF